MGPLPQQNSRITPEATILSHTLQDNQRNLTDADRVADFIAGLLAGRDLER